MHLSDVYDDAERVPDVRWLADAGDAGWCCLTQNFRIPRVPIEAEAIQAHNTRVFSFANASLLPVSQGLILGRNLLRIERRVKRADGCFWRISERPPSKDID